MPKKKRFNKEYTDDQYEADIKRLFENESKNLLLQPSIDMCIRFLEEQPTDAQVRKYGPDSYSSDSNDYASWNYALYGDWDDEAEAEGGEMWKWIAIYEILFQIRDPKGGKITKVELDTAFKSPKEMEKALDEIYMR